MIYFCGESGGASDPWVGSDYMDKMLKRFRWRRVLDLSAILSSCLPVGFGLLKRDPLYRYREYLREEKEKQEAIEKQARALAISSIYSYSEAKSMIEATIRTPFSALDLEDAFNNFFPQEYAILKSPLSRHFLR